MAIKTEKDLSENARSLWLKSLSAMEMRNHGYAISLLQAVLKEVPEFLDGRKMLRKAEIANTKGKKSFLSGLNTASLKGGSLVKKDPIAAMELAEKTLETDPYGAQGNGLLRDAARAAGFPEIAAFALQTMLEANPKDTKILHELGQHYYDSGDADKAVEIYTRITDINPADLIANKRGKDAAARASMKTGGWETAKDYRDLIKDKDVAVSLEQQNRVVKSEEMIEQQLAELSARSEQEPQNVDVAKKIATLLEQKGDLENAVAWYSYAAGLSSNTDAALVRKVSDLQLKQLEKAIEEREEFLKAAPDHESAPQYQKELEDLKRQKAETLISEARRRVERNPTDLQLRYELGEQLLNAGQHTEAIPELQKARQNPNARLRAMNLLGQCYTEKGMLDLAVKQFQDAASEIIAMDVTKKDILYKLGLVFEQMGRKQESLDCMKQIYEVDYGYRDVAQRVESSYGSE